MAKWVNKYFKNFWFKSDKREKDRKKYIPVFKKPKGTPYFNSIQVEKRTRSNELINEKEFIEVIYKEKQMWALFRCPCGCNTVISLSLQKVHNPYWILIASKNGRPTLYPSVWQQVGCQSHFWVNDGYIHWCNNYDFKDTE